MPAQPGRNRNAEKQKKKRAAAQQARKVQNARAKARSEALAKAAERDETLPDGAAPHPFAAAEEVDYDALDDANAEIKQLIKKKKLDDAEEKANALAKKYPRHSDGLQRLAEILVARGDKAKAIETLREAKKRPNDGDEEVSEEIDAALKKLGA